MAKAGPKRTWSSPKALFDDFAKFLEEQKPSKAQELRNVKSNDGSWSVQEVEVLKPQGLVTISQFAAWKGVHRSTVMEEYSEGVFKPVYKTMLATCEAYGERRLYEAEKGAAAIIFAMKNSYGWIDKTEHELSGSIDTPLSKEATAALNKALNGNEDPD